MLGDLRDLVVGINNDHVAYLSSSGVNDRHARFKVERRLNHGKNLGEYLLTFAEQRYFDILSRAGTDVVDANGEKAVVLPSKFDIARGVQVRKRRVGAIQEIVERRDELIVLAQCGVKFVVPVVDRAVGSTGE